MSRAEPGQRYFMCMDCRRPFPENKQGPFLGTCAYCNRLVVFQEKGARELYEMQITELQDAKNN